MDSTLEQEGAAPPRRRGAPKGNRNAWKHGGRSAAARAERERARAARVARLPDPHILRPFIAHAEASCVELAREAKNPRFSTNKTINSVVLLAEGEGDPPAVFSTINTNNSVAHGEPRKRGAPKGNKNALKHGMRSGERRVFSDDLRQFIRRLNATCALALALANAGKTQ
ncbi:MAG TPA: hypothetical protein VHU18_00375 [Rhizomicrobium sp.]|jgi:hypothetical protein|nr:hypothetical protein [Rhizomicrobium sp.]